MSNTACKSVPGATVIAFFPYIPSIAKFSSPYNGIIAAFEQLGIKLKIFTAPDLVGLNMESFNPTISEGKLVDFIRDENPICVISINNWGMSKEIRRHIKVPVVKWLFDDLEHHFLHSSFESPNEAFADSDFVVTYSSALRAKIEGLCPHLVTKPIFLPHATSIQLFKSIRPKAGKAISFIGSYLDVEPVSVLLQYYGKNGNTVPNALFSLMDALRENPDLDFDKYISATNLERCAAKLGVDARGFKRLLSDVITTQDRLAAIVALEDLNIKVYGRNDWVRPLLYRRRVSASYQFGKKLDDQRSLVAAYQASSITIDAPNLQNRTAISPRVVEAMASGALLIARFHPDSDLYKVFGSDCPVPTYGNLSELRDICKFYSSNETERLRIVGQCNQLVATGFDFKDRVRQVLQFIGFERPGSGKEVAFEIVSRRRIQRHTIGRDNISDQRQAAKNELEELEEVVSECIQDDKLQQALDLLIACIQRVFRDSRTLTRIYGSKRLDELCLRVGNRFENCQDRKYCHGSEVSVYIASHLAEFGGHTHLLEYTLRAEPGDRKTILLTDLFNHAKIDKLKLRFRDLAEFRVAPSGGALVKLEWLSNQLDEIGPKRIMLFNHHEDAVAIAAMAPWLQRSRVFFFHHADTNLCLGVHLPFAEHIDLHNIGYFHCRNYEQISSNRYAPLTVLRKPRRAASVQFRKNGALRSCSSGTYNKFSAEYHYRYFEFIVKRLVVDGGCHFHIGSLPPEAVASVDRLLVQNNVAGQRFIYIPWVPSLWTALVEHEIDLYISSFPLSGGLATLEAMGSGTPILAHQSSMSRFHGGVDLMYPSVLVWRNKEEFCTIIETVSADDLAKASEDGIRWFERWYSPELAARQLNEVLCGCEGNDDPPPLREYKFDSLERFLAFSRLYDASTALGTGQTGLERQKKPLIERIAAEWRRFKRRRLGLTG
jgi:hypothetical protein